MVLTPQLATLATQPPFGDQWLHEIKYDGYRLLARFEDHHLRLITRNGKDWTHRFPTVVSALDKLPVDEGVLDGEVALFTPDGASSFRRLQAHLGSSSPPLKGGKVIYQVFDLLSLDRHDLTDAPLVQRKRLLRELLYRGDADLPLRYSEHVESDGPGLFKNACEMGLEGIVSKRVDAPYRPGRNRSWLKIKCIRQDEFVVGGYTRPSGRRAGFGALLLGLVGPQGLEYAGRVGAGFSQHQLLDLHARLQVLEQNHSPFAKPVADSAGVRWVRPRIVVDVQFSGRTGNGALRHPVFRGLRPDKSPQEAAMPKRQTTSANAAKIAGVTITHPNRVVYAGQGATKLDLADYYQSIEDWIMPHLSGRPISLLRCPEGADQSCFYQRHPGASMAREIPRIAIDEKDGEQGDYLYVSSISDLIRLVQFGVLELHVWGSRISALERPDHLVFDLDPGPGVAWKQIAATAFAMRERLEQLGLAGFVQITGGKGVHIVVPIRPTLDWQQAKQFAKSLCTAQARDHARLLTTNMSRSKRKGRIFLDYLRNGRGNTSIARYSLRARKGAPVATPLRWDELASVCRADRYDIHSIRRRLAALSADPWSGFNRSRRAVSHAAVQKITSDDKAA